MMMALPALASMTSDLLMAPTPAWMTRTRTSSLESFSKALLYGLGAALHVGLDNDGKLLAFALGDLAEQVIQRNLLVCAELLFLLLGSTRWSASSRASFSSSTASNMIARRRHLRQARDLHRHGGTGLLEDARPGRRA